MSEPRRPSDPQPEHPAVPGAENLPRNPWPASRGSLLEDPSGERTAEARSVAEGIDKPAPLGIQTKIGVAVLAVAVLTALLWPRGPSSFEAPGGFLVDGDGRPVPLAQRLAPVTLVHFWATWCAPCVTEIPALKQLAKDFEDESDFDLVMIAVDDEAEKVKPFLGSLAPMALYDPSWDVANRYGTLQLPETYLVVEGQVVEVPSQERQRRETGFRLDGKNPRWVGQTDWGDPQIRSELKERLENAG
jgi:thiol-disulfide isomerase/thioredoxin